MFLVSFPCVCSISKFKKRKEVSLIWILNDSEVSRAGKFFCYRTNEIHWEQACGEPDHQRATGTPKNQIWNTCQIIWGPPYQRLPEAHTVYTVACNPLAWSISMNWAKINWSLRRKQTISGPSVSGHWIKCRSSFKIWYVSILSD